MPEALFQRHRTSWMWFKTLLFISSLVANGLFLVHAFVRHQAQRLEREQYTEAYLENLRAAAWYLDDGVSLYADGQGAAAAGQLYTAVDGIEIADNYLGHFLASAATEGEPRPDAAELLNVFDIYRNHIHTSIHALYQHQTLTPDEWQRLQATRHDIRLILDGYSRDILLGHAEGMTAQTERMCKQFQYKYARNLLCGHA